ncbi:MAG: hypothetical protein GZ088_09425 [Acidipila sp.]|nr:hypothetical protein [Acidipila sp.]
MKKLFAILVLAALTGCGPNFPKSISIPNIPVEPADEDDPIKATSDERKVAEDMLQDVSVANILAWKKEVTDELSKEKPDSKVILKHVLFLTLVPALFFDKCGAAAAARGWSKKRLEEISFSKFTAFVVSGNEASDGLAEYGTVVMQAEIKILGTDSLNTLVNTIKKETKP